MMSSRPVSEQVNSILCSFNEDLWINRRLKLDDVSQQLEQLVANNQLDSQDDKLFVIDWLRFIKFLQDECSGHQFANDKQWSELMNLMEISRKLNHRSVKFKHIIKNRLLIEANANSIRHLNESARLSETIGSSLKELELNLQSCCLNSSSLLAQPSSDNKLLLEELTNAQRHLQNTCWPLVYAIKLELDNELIGSSPQLDLWRAQTVRLESSTRRLSQFIKTFQQFETNLTHLKPLVISVANRNKNNSKSGSIQNNFDNSLSVCKQNFQQVLEFHDKLIEILQNQANKMSVRLRTDTKTTRQSNNQQLPLVRLLIDSKLVDEQIYETNLNAALDKLIECRKTLDKLMSSLRMEFGRFYFVNNIELLTIIALDSRLISECHHEQNQRLISKLFNNSICGFEVVKQTNITNLKQEEQYFITGVKSPFDELVPLIGEDPVPLKKRVNVYSVEIVRILNEIIRKLRRSLRLLLRNNLADYYLKYKSANLNANNIKQEDFAWSLPVQLMILAEQVKFTQQVELVLSDKKQNIDNLLQFYESHFSKLSSKNNANNDLINQLDQLKRSVALSIIVHFISTLVSLKSQQVSSIDDWNWQKLPRFRLVNFDFDNIDQNTDWYLEVCLANASFCYKFDYLPIQIDTSHAPNIVFKRLISSQTIERCFLVASQAISRLKLGASPFGPAGSGKTETIKALGHMLGCQVIVHNCDESNDPETLDRLLWGLAHTGLWGCFDEFNRLSASTLSSVSATLELIQYNLRECKTTVELMNGDIMSIDSDCAFFITLNPGDEHKYRGRRQLPANLRSLFLPISMTRVQIDTIVNETLLTFSGELNISDHFYQTKLELNASKSVELSRKLSNWVEWMQLSLQKRAYKSNRCEWDLRLILAILRRFKMALCHRTAHKLTIEQILVGAIENEVKSRLDDKEIEILNEGLIVNFGAVAYSLKLVSSESNLATTSDSTDDESIRKFVTNRSNQLEMQLKTRSGVILVGPTNSGKSLTWHQLYSTLTSEKIQLFALNPKCFDKKQLFGYVDLVTKKWIDGIFTKTVRQSLEILQTSEIVEQVWIILDGPIDPDWIESLNSVLDDNQVLTLGSGERLNFIVSHNKSIKLIFETTDIQFASPATISRLGMVFYANQVAQESSGQGVLLDCQWSTRNNANLLKATGASGKIKSIDVMTNEILLESFIVSNECFKLLIIAGNGPKAALVKNFTTRIKLVEYNCSEYSDSNHLSELLTSQMLADVFLINNIQLIKGEVRWGTRSFLELLRYALAYGCYHDSNLILRKIGKSKFIITTDTLDSLGDPRLLSMANVLKMKSTNRPNESVKQIDCPTKDLLENSSAITTLVHLNAYQIDDLPIEDMECEIMKFNNTNQARQTVESLSKMLNEDDRKDRKILVLNELELSLMDETIKMDLFHLLNRLRWRPGVAKFVYVCEYKSLENNTNQFDFWNSMGEIYHINNETTLKDLLKDKLSNKSAQLDLSIEDNGDQVKFKWLIEKIDKFLSSLADCESMGPNAQLAFVSVLIQLIQRAKANFSTQKATLLNGLKCLNRFEESVERIKLQRNFDDQNLEKRKQEIENLMNNIDAKLINGHKQIEKINELKYLQTIKTKEVESKSEKIESELKKVLPLVESSKQEVMHCLKPEALNEIKTLRSPPKTVKDILDVLFVFLGLNDSSWTAIKSYLTKYSLKEELANYNFKNNLDHALLAKVEYEMRSKRDSLTIEQASRASSAIVPILKWIQATLQYGHVLVKVKPLNEELVKLQEESNDIRSTMDIIEREQKEIDANIEKEKIKLNQLKLDYEEAKRKSEKVRIDLEQAQKVRKDLDSQVDRWQLKLESINSIIRDRELLKFCLLASSLAVYYPCGSDRLENLKCWPKMFDLSETTNGGEISLLTKILNLVEDVDTFNFVLKPDELKQMLQLVILRLCLTSNCPLVPFLNICDKHQATKDEVANYLSWKDIICSARDVIFVRASDESQHSNWIQSIEIALKMNKLIVFEMSNSPLDLDIMDIVLSSKRKLTSNSSFDTGPRIVLIGQLDQLNSHIRGLIRPMNMLMSHKEFTKSSDEISIYLSDLLAYFSEQDNFKNESSLYQVEQAIQCKQKETKLMELDLLKRLNTNSTINNDDGLTKLSKNSGLGGKTDMCLEKHHELIGVLSELHQLNETMKTNMDEMKNKLNEMKARQNQYAEFAQRAAKFYVDHLADLGKLNTFYQWPLKRYAELLYRLLNIANEKKTSLDEIVLSYAMQPMRPNCRLQFQDKLVSSSGQQSIGLFDERCANEKCQLINVTQSAAKRAANLKQTILDLVECKQTTSYCKLMILLHDSRKSSPQIEVDALFREANNFPNLAKHHKFNYHKLYATTAMVGNGAQSDHNVHQSLEHDLNRILSIDYHDDGCAGQRRNDNMRDEINRKQIAGALIIDVICIANAHLASNWLNARLLELIKASDEQKDNKRKLLIILIGESTIQQDVVQVDFDMNLLAGAHARYWHDELALKLIDRVNLFSSLLSDELETILGHKLIERLAKNKQTGIDEMSSLVNGLILFHVTCQELTTTRSDLSIFWHRSNYSFDYDQLCLAFKIFKQIVDDFLLCKTQILASSVRCLLCHLLDSVVYGSRMETQDDEILLKHLIEHFLGSFESTRRQLDKFEDLVRAEGGNTSERRQDNNNMAQYDRCLADFIAGLQP